MPQSLLSKVGDRKVDFDYFNMITKKQHFQRHRIVLLNNHIFLRNGRSKPANLVDSLGLIPALDVFNLASLTFSKLARNSVIFQTPIEFHTVIGVKFAKPATLRRCSKAITVGSIGLRFRLNITGHKRCFEWIK